MNYVIKINFCSICSKPHRTWAKIGPISAESGPKSAAEGGELGGQLETRAPYADFSVGWPPAGGISSPRGGERLEMLSEVIDLDRRCMKRKQRIDFDYRSNSLTATVTYTRTHMHIYVQYMRDELRLCSHRQRRRRWEWRGRGQPWR